MKPESNGYRIPVLLLIFNRPRTTAAVLKAVRKVRPRFLYIAADGPRDGNAPDEDSCKATRKVVELIDWPCEVRTLFRAENLGCRDAVSQGITWFFEHVEKGIVLEDDCVPTEEFFRYCEDLLQRYDADGRVMHIAGVNLSQEDWSREESYTFSSYTPIWGWATWRRAWQQYDADLNRLEEFDREGGYDAAFSTRKERVSRRMLYEIVRGRKIDTWDYQWNFAVLANGGLSIIPATSMVRNIGFGDDATHTRKTWDHVQHSLNKNTLLPLRHPRAVKVDDEYDRGYFRTVTQVASPLWRLILKRYLPVRLLRGLKRLMT